jgi:HAD superfamily hydrolase (TIGR01509 family)
MYKHIIEGKKAVLFDLDGTIVQTEPLWRATMIQLIKREGGDTITTEAILNEAGVPNLVKWQTMINKGFIKTTKKAEELSAENKANFINLVENSEVDVQEGFWELAKVLKIDKNLKLGLTTNTDKETAQKVLKKLGISETFDIYVFGDEVSKLKPNPEIYNQAAKRLNISPKDILVFEDSPAGAEAAYKAGMNLVIMWDTFTPQNLYPENVLMFIISFMELPYNLDKTFVESFKETQKELLDKEKDTKTTQQTQKPLQ